MRRRILTLAATATLAVLALPTAAHARPADASVQLQPDSSSGLIQTARPGTPVTMRYTLYSTTALTDVTLQTQQDPYLPAQGDVQLDGSPVTSSLSGSKDLTATIPSLPAGGHVLTFTARMSSSARANTASFAGLTWTDDQANPGTTSSTPAYEVDPVRPDLFVNTAGKGRVYVLSHSVGAVPGRIVEHGRAAVDALYTVTVTRGFRITGGPRFVSGTPAPCVRGPMHATCHITAGQLAQGAKTLVTPVTGPSGSTGRAYLSVTAADGEVDADPSDNAANVPVTVVRTADIQLHWSAGTTVINPGGTVTYHISIHNHGPDAAHVVFGAGVAWTDKNYRASFAGPGLRRYPDHSADFDLGVLRPGATTGIAVTVTAQTPGSYGDVLVAYSSTAYDPTYCIDSQCQLAGYREIDVRGGAARAHTTAVPTLNPRMQRKYGR